MCWENCGKDKIKLSKLQYGDIFKTHCSIKKIRKKWMLDTIVIDPGHGGKDPGTLGQKGTKEKDIVLDIALRLCNIIEKEMGVKVIYTRKPDVFIPLWKRTKIANESGGKVFISIHANSTTNNNVSGFETFLLRPGKTDDAIDVAQRENSVINLEDSDYSYKDLSYENLNLPISFLQNKSLVSIEEIKFSHILYASFRSSPSAYTANDLDPSKKLF